MPFLAPIGAALGVGTAATATTAATGVLASSLVGGLALGSGILGAVSSIKGLTQGAPKVGSQASVDSGPTFEQQQEKARQEAIDKQRRRTNVTRTSVAQQQALLAQPSTTGKVLLGG